MWFECDINYRTFLFCILSLSTVCGGYIITTPRRWTEGEVSQVCVILSKPATAEEKITFEMIEFIYDYEGEEEEEPAVLVPQTNIIIPAGKKSICQNILFPPTEEEDIVYSGEFTITGSLEGHKINYTKNVGITIEIVQIFIQTDKFIYKPSDLVQFRILTVVGAFLKVSLKPYKEIWIESPSGTNLTKWVDYQNDRGLIHLNFQLSDQQEKGEYKIKVRTSSGLIYMRAFQVENFVKRRFEVTINPPSYVLGTTDPITFEVCAQYTSGEPVIGALLLEVDNGGYESSKVTVTRESPISGCASFDISADELKINGYKVTEYYDNEGTTQNYTYYYYAYNLNAQVVVSEEENGPGLEYQEITVKVFRTALKFKDISRQQYYKPGFPYLAEIQVMYPDKKPARFESMVVCCDDKSTSVCKDLSTDGAGILKFAIPSQLYCDIRINAPGYPRINSVNDSSQYNAIMFQSGIRKLIKKYHSPSNSSLSIYLPNKELECTSTKETIDFNLLVYFGANQQASATVTVQVVSRGQIQFYKTFEQTFSRGSTPSIPRGLFIASQKENTNPELVKGSFTVAISLPKTVSPEAQILIFYARADGEVVADAVEVSVMECLLNSVNVEWSKDKALPGENVNISVMAEPLSLCSLGVVDKSVLVFTPKKYFLTVKRLLRLAQKGKVFPYEFSQVNDYEYCLKQQHPLGPTRGPRPAPTTPTPSSRKKREALESEMGSESLGRSKRDISIPIYYYYSEDVDAIYMFDQAGVYVLTDLTLESRKCIRGSYPGEYNYYYNFENYYYEDFYSSYSYGVYDYIIYFNNGLPGAGPIPDTEVEEEVDEEEEISLIGSNLPETWIWELIEVPGNGLYVKDVTLPDTKTEWIGSAVCVHPSKGVGVSSLASIIVNNGTGN